jgi:hypothetical protein
MHVTKAIRALLINETDVTDIVDERVYTHFVPQKAALPFVLIDVVSVTPSDCKDGVSTIDATRVQIDAFTSSSSLTADLDDYIRRAIDRVAAGEIVGVSIDGIKYDGTVSQFEDERQIKILSSDYQVRVVRNATLPAMPGTAGVEFESDAAAAIGGIQINQFYILSDNNIYGMTGGIPKKRKE